MKRNKPFTKSSNPSAKKRRYWHDERSENLWSIAVPQTATRGARTISTEGARPAGEGDNPEDPAWQGLCRWRIDLRGRSVLIYGTPYRIRLRGDQPHVYRGPLPSGEAFEVYTASRKCGRAKDCPLTQYYAEDIAYTLAVHRPGWCPAGVPGPGMWRYQGQFTALP